MVHTGAPTATLTMASDAGEREGDERRPETGGEGGTPTEAVVPPAAPLPPVQFWLPGFPAYKMEQARSEQASAADRSEDDRRRHRHHDNASASSAASRLPPQLPPLPPPPPPVFLALVARRACIPYTPAFQGIDLRVVRPLSAREKLAVRDAVSVLVRLGARVVGAEAGGLGVRGEMWSLSYVGF
jgi:hypothetical protein